MIALIAASAPATISAAASPVPATGVSTAEKRRGVAAEPVEQAKTVIAGRDDAGIAARGIAIGPAAVTDPVSPDHQPETDQCDDADRDEKSRQAAHDQSDPAITRADARACPIRRKMRQSRSLIVQAGFGTFPPTG